VLLWQGSRTFHIGVRMGDSSVSTAALTSYTPEDCTQTATKAITAKAAMGLLHDSQPWKPVAASFASSSVVVLALDAGFGFRPASWSALCFSAFNSTTPGAVGAAEQQWLFFTPDLRYIRRKQDGCETGAVSAAEQRPLLSLQNLSYSRRKARAAGCKVGAIAVAKQQLLLPLQKLCCSRRKTGAVTQQSLLPLQKSCYSIHRTGLQNSSHC